MEWFLKVISVLIISVFLTTLSTVGAYHLFITFTDNPIVVLFFIFITIGLFLYNFSLAAYAINLTGEKIV